MNDNTQCGGYKLPVDTCECCGELRGLILHHWYEPPTMEEHNRNICLRCNRILTTANVMGETIFDHLDGSRWRKMVWEYNHILPRWELQLAYARAVIDIRQDDRNIRNRGYSRKYRVKQKIIAEYGKKNGRYLVSLEIR